LVDQSQFGRKFSAMDYLTELAAVDSEHRSHFFQFPVANWSAMMN
jgi:hypothetical protein